MNARFGMTLASELHGPARLVDLAVSAEEHGFDFVSISDHFHPWINEQGHSPVVWSVLGAIAARTEQIEVGVGVTCPTVRIHPVILAQATATTANLLPGRFVWGVGTGEALNEQILGRSLTPRPEAPRHARGSDRTDPGTVEWRVDHLPGIVLPGRGCHHLRSAPQGGADRGRRLW